MARLRLAVGAFADGVLQVGSRVGAGQRRRLDQRLEVATQGITNLLDGGE